MTATVLTVRDLASAGVLDVLAAEEAFTNVDGAEFENNGDTMVYIRNAGAGAHIITVTTPRTVAGGLAVANPTFTVAAGKSALLPVFDPNYYNDGDGNVLLTSDGTMSEVKAVVFHK